MKNSWWISGLLLLFISGCQSIRPDHLKRISPGEKPVVIDYQIDSSALFKCSMEIRKHKLSGLMFIKNVDTAGPGNDKPGRYRIVFANEIGLTFFDFELSADSLQLLNALEPLRKKTLLNLLKMDYQLITGISGNNALKYFRKNPGGDIVVKGRQKGMSYWKQYSPGGDTLKMVGSRRSMVDMVFIQYEHIHGKAGRINIHHPVIGLHIKMRRLK